MTARDGADVPVARLDVENIDKRYGDTVALDELTLSARSGEILGIAGPNGAGKSTLVKVLSGVVKPDGGDVRYWGPDGQVGAFHTAVVYQETSLFPNLTVAENVCMARSSGHMGYPRPGEEELRVLRELRIEAFAHKTVSTCSLVVRQLAEIASALLVGNADIFLFDEPNSALTSEESELLFRRIHQLKDQGRVVFLVSHRLADLAEQCDRVAVIRDGCVAAELSGDELTEPRIAEELVAGIEFHTAKPSSEIVPPALQREALTLHLEAWTHDDGSFEEVSLTTAPAGVTAIVGNEGAGGRELVRSLAGFEDVRGRIELFRTGDAGASSVPLDDVEFMPAERQVSLFSNLTVWENLVARLGSPTTATRWGLFRSKEARSTARNLASQYHVRGGGLYISVRSLSGGNQQKVAIAGAIAPRPGVLVLEEPTRGVDISSKAEIYRLLREYAAEGAVVVCYCTEIPEVFELADRVVVLDRGRVVGVHEVPDFDDLTALAHSIASDVSVGAAS